MDMFWKKKEAQERIPKNPEYPHYPGLTWPYYTSRYGFFTTSGECICPVSFDIEFIDSALVDPAVIFAARPTIPAKYVAKDVLTGLRSRISRQRFSKVLLAEPRVWIRLKPAKHTEVKGVVAINTDGEIVTYKLFDYPRWVRPSDEIRGFIGTLSREAATDIEGDLPFGLWEK